MFDTILTSGLDLGAFCACLGTAFALGLILAIVHAKTTVHASQNFVMSLALLPMAAAIIIMLVNGNLGTSVAIVGAFSLVRFRSIAGNSRSILSIFLAMAIGLAVGTGYLGFATIFTVVVSLITFLLSVVHFGALAPAYKKLNILVPEDLDYTGLFDEIFAEFTREFALESVKTTNMGSLFALRYRVALKNPSSEKAFLDALRTKNGNLKISLSETLDNDGEL